MVSEIASQYDEIVTRKGVKMEQVLKFSIAGLVITAWEMRDGKEVVAGMTVCGSYRQAEDFMSAARRAGLEKVL